MASASASVGVGLDYSISPRRLAGLEIIAE
jgi:hypothetical protein